MDKTLDKYAVIGDPVKHSLSPVMHNAALKALNIQAEYILKRVKKEELSDFVNYAKKELCGFNITVPHKSAIIPFLDHISEEAKLANSVNTVTVKNGLLYGDTTDGYGLATAISEEFQTKIKGNNFCFIGCGGAVQAVSFYFAAQGAKSLFFINRTVSKAEELIQRIKENYKGIELECCGTGNDTEIKKFIDNSVVAIQGTSLGLNLNDPTPIPPAILHKKISFYDTIYKKTPMIKYAMENDINYADGRSMLLHQGAKAFSIWTKQEAPIDVMRENLYSAIDKKGQ